MDSFGQILSSASSHTALKARSLVVFGVVTGAVAFLGSIATSSSVESEWFAHLAKPNFYPPDATFAIVWSVLYVMIAIAGWLAWSHGGGIRTLIPWTIQLLLNLGWSVAFFGARRPDVAMIVIIALLVTSIWAAASMAPYSNWAAYLFVPYILWIFFAMVLNGAIISMN